MKTSLRNKVVIITGASAGIGRSAARLFAEAGFCVVLVARRMEALNMLKDELAVPGSQAMLTVSADVAKDQDLQRLYETVIAHYGRIDVLVNNAGVALGGALVDYDPERIRQVLAVNLYGPIRLTQLVLPVMLKQQSGHIVNISSPAGVFALPGETVYNASRSGLTTFSESLRREVSSRGVDVSVVMPGWTRTEMIEQMDEQRLRKAGLLMPLMAIDDPRVPAQAILDCVQHKRRRVLLGGPAFHMIDFLGRIMPGGLDWYLRHFMNTEQVCAVMKDLGA
ncbi:MAG TPA: SDR family oxidoreductase [Anaerolineales bacterium]|nr:SDR family oxidoreductase [Anaerolineales bacterium]